MFPKSFSIFILSCSLILRGWVLVSVFFKITLYYPTSSCVVVEVVVVVGVGLWQFIYYPKNYSKISLQVYSKNLSKWWNLFKDSFMGGSRGGPRGHGLEPQTLVIFCHEEYSNSYLMSRRILEYNRLDEYTKKWRSRKF